MNQYIAGTDPNTQSRQVFDSRLERNITETW